MVGPFPPPSSSVVGGQVSACKALRSGMFAASFDLRLIDSTQKSNPAPPLGIRAWHAMGRLLRLARELIANRPDGVLLFTTVGASYLEKGCMARVCRALGVPQALFVRGGRLIEDFRRSKIQRLAIKTCLGRATLFLCQGPAWRRFAMSELAYSLEQCPVIPNWTATGEYLSLGRARPIPRASSRPRVVYSGWLERHKGIEELLRAVLALRQEGRDFELTLIGNGTLMPWVTGFTRDNSLQDCVRLEGWKSAAEVRNALAEHDVFVLPSWDEGMPNSLIEAMSARLACICSRVGMVPDFLTDRQHALLIEPRQVDDLIVAMRTLITDVALRATLASKGFELASVTFAEDRVIPQLIAVLEDSLLSRRNCAATEFRRRFKCRA